MVDEIAMVTHFVSEIASMRGEPGSGVGGEAGSRDAPWVGVWVLNARLTALVTHHHQVTPCQPGSLCQSNNSTTQHIVIGDTAYCYWCVKLHRHPPPPNTLHQCISAVDVHAVLSS
jgi:hypothetical protein